LGTKSSSPEFTSAWIVAIMQGFNIVSALMFIGIIRHDKSLLNKTFAVVLFLLFLTINYVRYVYREANNYKAMNERYKGVKRQPIKGVLVLLYIILSTGLFLGLAIYGGAQNY
jgi:hypothetical protein